MKIIVTDTLKNLKTPIYRPRRLAKSGMFATFQREVFVTNAEKDKFWMKIFTPSEQKIRIN